MTIPTTQAIFRLKALYIIALGNVLCYEVSPLCPERATYTSVVNALRNVPPKWITETSTIGMASKSDRFWYTNFEMRQ